MKFRKKPVVIEAWQFNGEDSLLWPKWLEEYQHNGVVTWNSSYLVIPTLEGNMTASLGDWIILGVKGEVYPCKPDIFEMTYEAVESDDKFLEAKAMRMGARHGL